jgi:hypothetical protein
MSDARRQPRGKRMNFVWIDPSEAHPGTQGALTARPGSWCKLSSPFQAGNPWNHGRACVTTVLIWFLAEFRALIFMRLPSRNGFGPRPGRGRDV